MLQVDYPTTIITSSFPDQNAILLRVATVLALKKKIKMNNPHAPTFHIPHVRCGHTAQF